MQKRLGSIIGGSIGNLVEWYDWYAYSAFTLYFADAFFPKSDAVSQQLNAAGIFALGFLMRPVGGWLLGWYADRYGRRTALTASVLLMCAGSLLIAVTPTFATIGVAAPVILLLARLLQGLSVGGEYGASATYLSEMAGQTHRGFWSSFQYVTLIMGQLVALGLLILLQKAVLGEAQLHDWGWRIPFAVGAVLALVALFIRRHIAETTSFEKAGRPAGSRTLRLITRHSIQALQVFGLTLGGTVAFYTYTTYMQKFLVGTAGWSKPDATLLSAATLGLYMLAQPLYGALSDRIGRRPLLVGFGVLGVICTWPIMTTLSHTHDFLPAFLLVMAALLIVSGYTSINAVVKAELFPAEVRALGVALPYALAVSFGGSAEYVAQAFKKAGHESGFFWYVTGCIAASLLVYLWMPDTKTNSAFHAEN